MKGFARAPRIFCAPFLALLLLAAPLAARPSQIGRVPTASTRQAPLEAQIGEIRVAARYDWPSLLTEGWFPLQVAVENRGAGPARVELEARGIFRHRGARVRTSLELEPGGSERIEFLLPVLAWLPSQYQVRIRAGSDEETLLPLGPGEYPGSRAHEHLVVPAPGTSASTVEEWRAHLLQGATRATGLTALHGAESLARHPAAYSSLCSISLDVGAGLPAGEVLEALVSWVRTGGDLALYGPRAELTARAHLALASWMESRFELGAPEASPRVWRLGHGRLLVGGLEPPFSDPGFRQALLEAPEELPLWHLGTDLEELPVRTLTVFLMLFAVLIGPVNFILVRRSGRPTLLLLTVPLIALVASLALVLYAVLAQGLGVRSTSHSWTVLDQRAALASVRELRDVFAGTSPGPGLRPGPRTSVVLPLPVQNSEQQRGNLEVEQQGGQLLAGDFLRVRVSQTTHVYSERPTRARLDVRREEQEVWVENGLGVRAHDLFVRTGPDELWVLREPLAAGARVRLTRADAPEHSLQWVMRTGPWRWRERIPTGTWSARLERSPFLDECGLELDEVFGRHLTYGILEDPVIVR